MAEPVSWQVLEFLQARLQQISIANGFRTDLGAGPVALDREQIAETDAPSTIVLGTDFPPGASPGGKKTTNTDMDIVIEFQIPYESTDNPFRLAHRARADVLRVLNGDLRGGPAGFRTLSVTGSSITEPEGSATTVVAQVTARAGLSESLDPAP